MVLIKNAVDTWVNQDAPNKNYGNTARLHVRSSAGANRYAWLFFTRPWPPGSVIISAKLRLWQGDTLGTSATVQVQRAAAKWHVNRITHATIPSVVTGTASQTKATSPAGTMWEVDVTTLVQAVADGGAWYGFRIATTSATDHWFHSTQATTGAYRPVLEVTWSMPPDMPDGISPAAARYVSVNKPIVRGNFRDKDGENTMASIQVQIDAAGDFSTGIDFDSGTVAASYPQYDLSGSIYAGLADNALTWMRMRLQDSAGAWSPWSLPVQWGYATLGTLTITAPATNFIDGSPTITWTFTGRTQKAYQVIIAPTNDPLNWVWDSGKVSALSTSVSVPFGKIIDTSITYTVTVRIWDTVNREEVPNGYTFRESQKTNVSFAYSGSVTPVSSLNVSSDPLYPIANLTWTRSSAPTHYQIQRSDDAGATWDFVAEYTGAELSTGGTNYAAKDTTAAPYTPYLWRVLAVDVSLGMSASNPTASGEIRRLAPFLMRTDGSDPVVFMNPSRSQKYLDKQEVHETLGGAPAFVVTQKLGGVGGSVSGSFDSNVISGLTAKEMKRRFKAMRKDAGVPMILSIVDEQLRVVPYNMQIETRSSAGSGIHYLASFDYVEV